MSPKEALETFDNLLKHLDQMLSLDDQQLNFMLNEFTQEHPNEGKQILDLLQDRRSLEEERLRVLQMKVDYISEWLQEYQSRSWQDPNEIDEVLKMLNVNPDTIQSAAIKLLKDVS